MSFHVPDDCETLLRVVCMNPHLAAWGWIGDDADEVSRTLLRVTEDALSQGHFPPRTIECLDRLQPPDAADAFRPYLGQSILDYLEDGRRPRTSPLIGAAAAAYAWGRRLPSSNRRLLLDLADEVQTYPMEGTRAEMSKLRFCDALTVAWAEHCPKEEHASLLLPPAWNEANLSGQIEFESSGAIFAEYEQRVDDGISSVPELVSAAEIWKNEPVLKGHAFPWRAYPRYIVRRLIDVFAPLIPHTRQVSRLGPAVGWEWLMEQICATGHADAARALRSITTPGYEPGMWYRYLTASWPADRWRLLVERLDEFTGAFAWEVFDRLAQIVPPGEIDFWLDLLNRYRVDNKPVIAFCKWLEPEQSDRLLEVVIAMRRRDFDTSVCAFQAYLHSGSFEGAKGMRRHRMPEWRWLLIDRWLYAPEPLKPKAIAYGIQEIEADFRLRDPLDIRGY